MTSSKAWKSVAPEMKGLEFTTNYGTNSTIHKISGLSEKSARESLFTKVSGSFNKGNNSDLTGREKCFCCRLLCFAWTKTDAARFALSQSWKRQPRHDFENVRGAKIDREGEAKIGGASEANCRSGWSETRDKKRSVDSQDENADDQNSWHENSGSEKNGE